MRGVLGRLRLDRVVARRERRLQRDVGQRRGFRRLAEILNRPVQLAADVSQIATSLQVTLGLAVVLHPFVKAFRSQDVRTCLLRLRQHLVGVAKQRLTYILSRQRHGYRQDDGEAQGGDRGARSQTVGLKTLDSHFGTSRSLRNPTSREHPAPERSCDPLFFGVVTYVL